MATEPENVSKTCDMRLQLDLAFLAWEARAHLMIHEHSSPHRVTTPSSRRFLLTLHGLSEATPLLSRQCLVGVVRRRGIISHTNRMNLSKSSVSRARPTGTFSPRNTMVSSNRIRQCVNQTTFSRRISSSRPFIARPKSRA